MATTGRPARRGQARHLDRLGRVVVEGQRQQRVARPHGRDLLGPHGAEVVDQVRALAHLREAVDGVGADAEGAARGATWTASAPASSVHGRASSARSRLCSIRSSEPTAACTKTSNTWPGSPRPGVVDLGR